MLHGPRFLSWRRPTFPQLSASNVISQIRLFHSPSQPPPRASPQLAMLGTADHARLTHFPTKVDSVGRNKEVASPKSARWLQMLQRYDHQSDRKSTRLNSSHVKISYAVF